MHHLVFLNPRSAKGKRPRRKHRKTKSAAAVSSKTKRTMKHRKHRRRKTRVVRNVRRRRRAARRAHRRRNPVRRIRRRNRRRFAVAHVIRRIRSNPSSGGIVSRNTLGVAGGAAGMAILGCYIPAMTVRMMPNGTSVNTAHLVNAGIKLGIGFLGSKLLRRSSPTIAQGVMVGAIVSVAYDIFSMISPMNSAPAAAATPGALANTAATAGTQATGTARYLGAGRRRRRMSSYLGQYLQPGQPITSMIGPVTAGRRTFGNRAGGLGNIYTSPGVFKNAWAR